MRVAALALGALAVPVAAGAAYLAGFVAFSSKPPAPPPSPERHRFLIIVPSHNEELGIAETVRNLQQLDYPADAYSILVVADNCVDATAARAREAGAEVLDRTDDTQRGKGYALLYAFERLPESVSAVVVVDADTLVSKNLLSAFSARLALGAHAIQADYAVRNSGESWRTRLMAVAFGSFHIIRGRARERLRLSAGLRGNGMCFSKQVLCDVPHDAFSIVEDVEYGIRLGKAGYRVHYADDAHVYGEMVTSAKAAESQRQRWEGGRDVLRKNHMRALLRLGWEKRNAMLFELGLDLLMPPLSQFALSAVAGWGVSTAAALVWGGPLWLVAGAWGSCVAVVGVYVLRGWSVSGTGLRGLLDLGLAPVYVVWKLAKRAPRSATDGAWVRTRREAEGPGVGSG